MRQNKVPAIYHADATTELFIDGFTDIAIGADIDPDQAWRLAEAVVLTAEQHGVSPVVMLTTFTNMCVAMRQAQYASRLAGWLGDNAVRGWCQAVGVEYPE